MRRCAMRLYSACLLRLLAHLACLVSLVSTVSGGGPKREGAAENAETRESTYPRRPKRLADLCWLELLLNSVSECRALLARRRPDLKLNMRLATNAGLVQGRLEIDVLPLIVSNKVANAGLCDIPVLLQVRHVLIHRMLTCTCFLPLAISTWWCVCMCAMCCVE
ncbi:hypothetical protein GQ54DRAFT_59931 [Martensiomyces pterosporus]|nr:hypothetical protein GQ54DRAFT_59931 [Martensiomyces pterosporus]